MSATPCVVLFLNRVFFKEQISTNNVLGIFISTIGVLFLITQGNFTGLEGLQTLSVGDLWTMGSALSWAFYCTFLRKKNKNIDNHAFVTVCSIIGALILFPLTLSYLTFFSPAPASILTRIEPSFLFGLAYLVIFPSWLSYVFWSKGVAIIGTTRGEIFTHLIPLSAGLISIVFLHSPLYSYHFISAILIIFGIILCSKKMR